MNENCEGMSSGIYLEGFGFVCERISFTKQKPVQKVENRFEDDCLYPHILTLSLSLRVEGRKYRCNILYRDERS